MPVYQATRSKLDLIGVDLIGDLIGVRPQLFSTPIQNHLSGPKALVTFFKRSSAPMAT